MASGTEARKVAVCLRRGPGDRQTIVVRWPADDRLTAPTLFLDATADPTILEAIRPGIEFHRIDVVRRTGQVVQVIDHRLSKSSLLTDANASSNNLARVQAVLDRYASSYERALVVTYKAAKPAFTLPEGWVIDHFGNLRGIDKYKDCDAVFIIGNPLPPLAAVEDQAVVLARLAGQEIECAEQWDEEIRGYRLANGQRLGVKVRCDPNPLADACLRQHREAEIEQAIDRLRLIHCPTPKDVFVLTSVPVNVTVTETTTLDELALTYRYPALLDRFGGVLPKSPAILAAKAPGLFATEKAAEHWLAKRLPAQASAVAGGDKPPNGYSNILAVGGIFALMPSRSGPSTPLAHGTFRRSKQRGKTSTFLFRADHPTPRRALEAVIGPLDDYDGPTDLPMDEMWLPDGLRQAPALGVYRAGLTPEGFVWLPLHGGPDE